MKKSRGLRNNNPGNIRHGASKWVGLVPGDDSAFCTFSEMKYGYRAMIKLLQNYKKLHGCDTIRKIINRWAPPNENNTPAYVLYVAGRMGKSPDVDIDVNDKGTMVALAAAISAMENGEPAVVSDIEAGWETLT